MNNDIVLATPITRAVRAEIAYLGGVVPWATMLLPALRVEQAPTLLPIERSLLEIQASSAIGRPLGTCVVQERCGRVYTVAFTPHAVAHRRVVDPVLPLVLMPLGDRYGKAMRAFAKHTLDFWPGSDIKYQEKWWAKALKLCNACLGALEGVADAFTTEELAYIVVRLQDSLAWPHGREERNEIRSF